MVTNAFEQIAGTLDYPMVVVTTTDGQELSGCLVGFHTQCSIDPVRFFVCISRANHTHRVALGASALVVHVLRDDQYELARIFGEETGDSVDKFEQCPWHAGPEGLPILDGCDWFKGTILERIDLGDHVGHHLTVDAAARVHARRRPLGYQQVRDMEPGHGA